MLGYTLVKTVEIPFIKDIHRLIKAKPEYAEGIRQGVVHLAYDPGQKPRLKSDKYPVKGE